MYRVFAIALLAALAGTAAAAVDRDRSQKLYEEALGYFRSDSFAEASIQLRNALQQDPKNLPARIMLGRVLLRQDEPHAAIKELEKAQAMGGDENLILVPLAMAYMEIAEPEHVITGFVAEGHNPEVDGELLLLQAEAYAQLADAARAEELYLRAGTLLPVDPRPLLGRARIQLNKRKPERAVQLLDEAIQLNPESVDAWMFKALMHRDYAQYREALTAFEKVLALDPTSSRALTARAALWMDIGQMDKARDDLQAVENLGSDSLESIYLRTLLLFRDGRPEDAREALRAGADEIKLIKDDYRAKLPNTILMLGIVSYFEGNFSEAVTHLKSFLGTIPGHIGALRYLVAAHLELGEAEAVVKLMRSSNRGGTPRDAMLLSMLAEAYRVLGNHKAAEQHFQAAVELAPDVAGIGIRLAASRLDAGRAESAISELERLTKRFPDLSEGWVQLARVYAKTGDKERAVEVVKQMIERFPDSAQLHNVAGATFMAAGDLKNARLQFKLATELDTEQVLPHLNLARVTRADGDAASAEAQYRTILERFPHSSEARLELAEILIEHAGYDEAMELVDKVIEAEPRRYAAHEMRLKIIFSRNDEAERIRSAIYDLMKEFPKEPRAELMAGRAYRALGNTADARIHIRRAVEFAKFDADLLFIAANQQYAIGDFTGALWSLTKAEQGSPDHLGVGVLKAAVHIELEEFTQAEEALEALIKRFGETPQILTVKGDWHMAQDQRTEAVAAYTRAYESAPESGTAQTLFRAQIHAGQTEAAAALMSAWISQHPGDVSASHVYAQFLMARRDWKGARDQYERLQAGGVEDVVLLNNLAVCYQHLRDARALPIAELAHKQAPDDPNVADTYGWILLEHGRLEEGLALLREAFARASTSPAIRYHIGLALARLGRTGEAREELEAALTSADGFSARDDAANLLEELESRDETN